MVLVIYIYMYIYVYIYVLFVGCYMQSRGDFWVERRSRRSVFEAVELCALGCGRADAGGEEELPRADGVLRTRCCGA
jgi:hypothetical protein